MLKVTEFAAEKLKAIIAKNNNPENIMLRIAFGGYGWGGPQLNLTLDELIGESDKTIESQGIKVVFESDIEGYIQNSVVDYANSLFERGFVIRGANLSSCWLNENPAHIWLFIKKSSLSND